MVIFYSEDVKSSFDGTIIDIETIGDFCRGYGDSREYKDMVPTIFGYINKNGLNIYCAKEHSSLDNLKETVLEVLPKLERPFYAFNSVFETGVLYHAWDVQILFEHELNEEKYEAKGKAVKKLKISNYNDPFYNVGRKCQEAWERGETEKCIAHNRSCLLKERDIMLRRRRRNPDDFILFRD